MFRLAIGLLGGSPTPTPTPSVTVAGLMGQSELEYLLNNGSTYRQITQPTPGNGNLIVYTQSGDDAAPVKTTVDAASVAAGQVNPAMAGLSAFLAYARPGWQFVLGDLSVPGTSRFDLSDDSTDGTDTRKWTDFTSVVTAVETDYGTLGHLIECWYNADAAYITTFKDRFWPMYFGANADGSAFALGGTVNSRKVDHCLYDASAAPGAKGRGVFARSATKWHVLTPMPFLDAPVSPSAELTQFNGNAQRLSEPARAVVIGLADNALAQSVNISVGPSAHVCRFGGTSTEIHPDTGTKDGQILLMWPIAIALLRASGLTIGEPAVYGVSGPTDGSYVDLVIDLPNGGNLTTLAALRSTSYAGSAPHQQAVTGIEISRAGGTRRPVYKTSETSYPAAHRGTVTITDSGSGSPRRGKVRITPTNAFAFGDSLSYLRGQATAALVEPRDFDLYPWMLIEHVPALYDATALYPMEGIAVRPFQQEVAVPVPAPPFVARGANFDGGDYYAGSGISIPAGSAGIASFWVRATSAWTTTKTIFEARVGSTVVCSVVSASSNRCTFRLNQDGTGSDTFTTPTNTFAGDAWYHILWAWDYAAGRFQIYVNGVALSTSGYSFTGSTKFDQDGASITQFGLGATTAGAGIWTGDFGHFYIDVTQSLDLSVQANREKFALAGAPVDLGPTGALPTGNVPEWYYDGAGAAWASHGTAGNVALTGTLAASSSAPSY